MGDPWPMSVPFEKKSQAECRGKDQGTSLLFKTPNCTFLEEILRKLGHLGKIKRVSFNYFKNASKFFHCFDFEEDLYRFCEH